MKKVILASTLALMVFPVMAHAVSMDELIAFSSMSYNDQREYMRSMESDEREKFADALRREHLKEERRRAGITENDVRPICQTVESIVIEAAQYRDEGYPLHRVLNNADAQLYSARMDQMIPAARNYVYDMYNNSNITPNEIGELAFSECMGHW